MLLGLAHVPQPFVRHLVEGGLRLGAFHFRLSLLKGCQCALALLVYLWDFEQREHVTLSDVVPFITSDPLHVSRNLGIQRRLSERLSRSWKRHGDDRRLFH